MKTINIKTIRTDGGTQSRVKINNKIITEYAEAIKAGAEFPPVVVFNDGADNWIADGFHRFHAHNQAGKTSIAADVRQGTLRDAKLFSFGANGKHGHRPSNADRRKAVLEMLNDAEWSKWSDNQIAKTCDVHHSTVATHRRSLAESASDKPTERTYKTKQGTTATMQTGGIGKKKVESDSTNPTKKESSKAKPTVAANDPQSAVTPLALVEEYTALDAARDQIEGLQDALAVANIGSADPEEAAQAKNLIAELRAHIKTLEATLKAVKTSRDGFQNQVAEMQKQINRQRREIDKLAGTRTA
jgi:hypothetical protein